MSNTILSYINWVFAAVSQIAVSGSSTNDNGLKTPQLSDATVWTENPPDGGGIFEFDATATLTPGDADGRTVQVLGLAGVHLVQYGTLHGSDAERAVDGAEGVHFRIIGKNYAGTEVFNTGWQPVKFRPETLRECNVFHVLDEAVENVYTVESTLRVDATTFPDPLRVSVGALWAGPGFSTQSGLQEGWTMTPIDPGVMDKSKGEQGYPGESIRTWQLNASWAPVAFDVAYGNAGTPDVPDMQTVMSIAGKTGFVVMMPRTKDASDVASPHVQRRLGIYGHFSELGSLVDQGGNNFVWGPFTVTELL